MRAWVIPVDGEPVIAWEMVRCRASVGTRVGSRDEGP